ncbi:hypothetical protein BGX27_006849 [Mortierella sp. AM989]|nr:hypothetical protein BGX27_006849 [Mortierella sp. AM989]
MAFGQDQANLDADSSEYQNYTMASEESNESESNTEYEMSEDQVMKVAENIGHFNEVYNDFFGNRPSKKDTTKTSSGGTGGTAGFKIAPAFNAYCLNCSTKTKKMCPLCLRCLRKCCTHRPEHNK